MYKFLVNGQVFHDRAKNYYGANVGDTLKIIYSSRDPKINRVFEE